MIYSLSFVNLQDKEWQDQFHIYQQHLFLNNMIELFNNNRIEESLSILIFNFFPLIRIKNNGRKFFEFYFAVNQLVDYLIKIIEKFYSRFNSTQLDADQIEWIEINWMLNFTEKDLFHPKYNIYLNWVTNNDFENISYFCLQFCHYILVENWHSEFLQIVEDKHFFNRMEKLYSTIELDELLYKKKYLMFLNFFSKFLDKFKLTNFYY
jgi:hypothetical protein